MRPGVDLRRNPTYVVPDLGCTRSMASRRAINAFARESPKHGIKITYRPCRTTFVFADSEKGTVKLSCVLTFPTRPPCTTQIDILEKGIVPILLSLSQMKNLGISLNLHPGGDRISCVPFGLRSSPVEVSQAGRIVLNLAELFTHPGNEGVTRTNLTFLNQTHETAWPLDGENAEEPAESRERQEPAVPFRASADCRTCQGHHRKHTCGNARIAPIMPREEDASSSNSPPGLATRAPAASILAPPLPSPEATQENDNRKAKKALRKIIEDLINEKTLRNLHLEHYHMATSQFKKANIAPRPAAADL